MKFDRANDPRAARLVESLRYLGYGNYHAIADLVDNSIDADASRIQILIHQRHGEIEIVVADNGIGMDFATLDEAMRLGSDIPRDVTSDLGKFGMGLVTASLSLARRCHLITRGGDGCWSSIQDVDEVIKQQAFVKHLAKATKGETDHLDALIGVGNTGTVVTLTGCDNISNRNTTSFASQLMHHLGRVHRYFLEADRRRIEVDGDRVEIRDPLQLDSNPEIVLDDLLLIKGSDNGAKTEENVRVRIALVPEATASELDISRSMKAQGFYIMRNQREVMDAVTLEMFTKHNDFNRMRGEIFFPGTLDNLVGIEFTKRQVHFNQSLFDQLAQVIVPICRSIKRSEATRKREETSEAHEQLHLQSAKAISEKDKLLLKPKARIERRASPSRRDGGSAAGEGAETERERKNLGRTQLIEARLNCGFRHERLGPNGQIYEVDVEGRKIIIRYNVEHPFYQHFLVDALGDGKMASATDFLIYSMASAELRMLEDGDFDAVNSFKAVMSANLRTLLN